MLIEFFGENYGCFRDDFRLSMLATDIDPADKRGVIEAKVTGDPEPLRLLRLAAIYGPNASGKSTILRAARALGMILREGGRLGSDEPIPGYEPFAGGGGDKPTVLGVKAILEGAVYDYEIKFKQREILVERLQKYENGDPVVLLHRQGDSVGGVWAGDQQFQLISGQFRPNAVLLSLADTLAPALAQKIAPGIRALLVFYNSSADAVSFRFNEQPAAERAERDNRFKDWLLGQLKAADVGVVGMTVKRQEVSERSPFRKLGAAAGTDSNLIPVNVIHQLELSHSAANEPFKLPFDRESLGTQKLVGLAPVLYELFKISNLLMVFVDEIGASLHPTLLSELVGHANRAVQNDAVQAQMVFATHDTSLIDGEARKAILRRDQVYLTQKDAQGAAKLYSLGEFKERQNVNIRKRYLEGRYGAIPALGHFPE